VIFVIVLVLIRVGAFRGHTLNTDPWRVGLGTAFFAGGLALAVWARIHLGRNWGTPMTEKDDPELVTSGPYHLIRHPIYSGILFAGVGTAVALSWFWLIAVVLAVVYFVYSAIVEERYLTERFPDAYPVYKRSTKMLLPYISLTRHDLGFRPFARRSQARARTRFRSDVIRSGGGWDCGCAARVRAGRSCFSRAPVSSGQVDGLGVVADPEPKRARA
jgi:protein-S-isoprenylcysteine O-methyltransferase Ste14